jgi:hypothetical protein
MKKVVKKSVKKAVRKKKNLAAKPLVQRIYALDNELFTLAAGKLIEGGLKGWRSLRLSALREALETSRVGQFVEVTYREKGNGSDTYSVAAFPEGHLDEVTSQYGPLVRVGCKTFIDTNATKLLARARVTL